MKKIFKFTICIICVISLVFSSGCYDYSEYEQMLLVSALGIDYDESTSQITVSIVSFIPSGGSQNNNGGPKHSSLTTFIKADSQTIGDAFLKIQQSTGKRLFFGYLDILVVGNGTIKNEMSDLIALVDRAPQIRTSAYIVTTDEKAENVLNTVDPDVTTSTGKHIHGMIDQAIYTGSAYPVTLQDFEIAMAMSGMEPTAPKVTVENQKSGTSSQNNQSSSNENSSSSQNNQSSSDENSSSSQNNQSSSNENSSSSQNNQSSSDENSSSSEDTRRPVKSEEKTGYFIIDGMTVFKKSEFKGFLNMKESTGLEIVTNKTIYPYVIVRTSKESKPKHTLLLRITDSKSKIKFNIKDDKPEIDIETTIESDLKKFSAAKYPDLLTPDVLNLMQKDMSDIIKSDITSAIKKSQKDYKTDIFGIGFEFYRKHPYLWHKEFEKKWDNIYPDIKINVNVNAKITNTGTSLKRLSPK